MFPIKRKFIAIALILISVLTMSRILNLHSVVEDSPSTSKESARASKVIEIEKKVTEQVDHVSNEPNITYVGHVDLPPPPTLETPSQHSKWFLKKSTQQFPSKQALMELGDVNPPPKVPARASNWFQKDSTKSSTNILNSPKRFALPLDHVDKESCQKRSRNIIITHVDRPYRFFLHPPGEDIYISDTVVLEADTGKYFEEGMRNSLRDMLKDKPNAVVLDIGANIGLHTFYLASMGYEVHAFEPHPGNNRLLACSIIYNSFDTVKFNPFGLSLEDSEACIETSQSYNQGHAVVSESNHGTCKTSIQVKRLDKYLEANQVKPYLVKIDIEGYELRALLPAKEYFRKNPPAVFLTEFAPNFMEAAGSDPEAYLDFFWDLGYKVTMYGQVITKNTNFKNTEMERSGMVNLVILRGDLL